MNEKVNKCGFPCEHDKCDHVPKAKLLLMRKMSTLTLNFDGEYFHLFYPKLTKEKMFFTYLEAVILTPNKPTRAIKSFMFTEYSC